MKIAVVGLGYVGLPLALEFAKSGAYVVGVEPNRSKLECLSRGESYLRHLEHERVRVCLDSGCFTAVEQLSEASDVDAVIITVPTPLNRYREPDLSHVIDAGKAIGAVLRKGMLVVLESTTHPGTTDGELRDVLEEASGLEAGRDFCLAYSPEREDPGNKTNRFATTPKIVGGLTESCLERATELYKLVVETVVPVSTCRTAEAAKLLENVFRSVNIALVNELKVIYRKMDIDIWEVIEAAKTKPFGFMAFYPGPGLGGHCIPVDPFYLSWKAREYGEYARFIELAGEINTVITEHVVMVIMEALNASGIAASRSRILILGVAYKPDIEDDRQSPAYVIMEKLISLGADVSYHDPFVPEIPPHDFISTRIVGMRSVDFSEESVSSFDLAVVITHHTSVDHAKCLEWVPSVVDCRNVLPSTPGKVWRA